MPEITRVRPAEDADERSTLTGLLDFLRSTVELKLTGLTDAQAFARPVHPSALTPAGIVKHLTAVERFWFAIDFAGSTSSGRGPRGIRTAVSRSLPATRSMA